MIALLLVAQLAAPVVTMGTFHHCGDDGSAKVARVRPLNRLKNRAIVPTHLNPDVTLDALFAPGNDRRRFSENDGAQLTGLVVDVKVGGIESVNCGARDARYRDTHIAIVVHRAQSAYPVIVEVTPRWREAMATIGVDWSTAALHRDLVGKTVTFEGYLFNDVEHAQNATNTNPRGTARWRATTWEIHPVTAIRVQP